MDFILKEGINLLLDFQRSENVNTYVLFLECSYQQNILPWYHKIARVTKPTCGTFINSAKTVKTKLGLRIDEKGFDGLL